MAAAQTYQSEFTGSQMDERFRAVATLTEALTVLEQAIAAKYTKPADGIPSTDMDASVQSALALALTSVQSLADYYTKSEVDSIAAAIAATVNATSGEVVASLPTASASTLGKIYYVGPTSGEYDRYVTSYDGTTYSWLQIGTTDVDMTQYATKAELSQLDQELYGETVSIGAAGLTATNDFYNADFSFSHHGGTRYMSEKIAVKTGQALKVFAHVSSCASIIAFDSAGDVVSAASDGESYDGLYTVPAGVASLIFQTDATGTFSVTGYAPGDIDFLTHKDEVLAAKDFDFSAAASADRPYYGTSGTKYTNANRTRTIPFPVMQGDSIKYRARNNTSVFLICALDANKVLLPTVSVAGTGVIVSDTYAVPAGVAYLIVCSDDFSDNNYAYIDGSLQHNIDELDKKIDSVAGRIKTYGCKMFDFSTFSGTAWAIAADKGSAESSTAGFANRLQSSIKSYEDTFEMGVELTPVGTSFEVGIGKFADVAGTMFILRKDGNGSFLDIYNIASSSSQTLSDTKTLSNVTLASGSKYWISAQKKTAASNVFIIAICDYAGNTDTFEIATTLSAWGQAFVVMLSGTSVSASGFSFGYHIKQDLELVIWGHSWVEGNSISGSKENRWVSMVEENFSPGHVLILGHGGESATGGDALATNYAVWFKNAKYFLILIDSNGLPEQPTAEQQAAYIEHYESIDAKLKDNGIIPVWICGPGPVSSYQNGVDYFSDIHDWLMAQEYVVDIRGCFIDGNSNDATKYQSDQKHPTNAAHVLIYNAVRAQAPYLFDA